MRDESLRRLKRGLEAGGEVQILLAQVRSGTLQEDNLQLAAYLGHEPAESATGLRLERFLSISDWLWGLWDWGGALQGQVLRLILQGLLPLWEGESASAIPRAAFERIELALSKGVRLGQDQTENLRLQLLELEAETTESGQSELVKAFRIAVGVVEGRWESSWDEDYPVSVGELAAREACGTARSSLRVTQIGVDLLGWGLEDLRLAIRQSLLSSVLDGASYAKPDGVSARARSRIVTFEQRRGGRETQHIEERGWAYLPNLPFAEEVEQLGRDSEEASSVCADWRSDDDAVFLQVFVQFASSSGQPSGFTYGVRGEHPEHLEVVVRIAAPCVTRVWFEASMLAWAALSPVVTLSSAFKEIGREPLRIYFDAGSGKPAGWLGVSEPELVVAILMTCRVSELSLGSEAGLSVLEWIAHRVRGDGFEPPRLAVHSQSDTSAEQELLVEQIHRSSAC
ncbi:MAG: hypothetical protein JKY65_01820 [Planctomycetes bacterium]|nr:hypothetical protein [Planctomycetota bacterium]